MELLIVQIELSGSRLDRPRKYFYQGGFPGSILAHQGMHPTAVKTNADIIQRTGSGIIFDDMFRSYLENAHLVYLKDSVLERNRDSSDEVSLFLCFNQLF